MYGILGTDDGEGGDRGIPPNRGKIQRIAVGIGVILVLGLGVRFVWRTTHRPHVPMPPPVIRPAPKKGYQPEGIVIHHSETPGKVGKIVVNAARINEMHKHSHPDWARQFEGKTYYIGYHYVILPDGTVEAGRPELCVGSHAKHHNNWLGICLVGAFSRHDKHKWEPSQPTTAQKQALVKLCAKMIRKYEIPLDHVKRHSDVWQTWCPGERFPYSEIMADIRLELSRAPLPTH